MKWLARIVVIVVILIWLGLNPFARSEYDKYTRYPPPPASELEQWFE